MPQQHPNPSHDRLQGGSRLFSRQLAEEDPVQWTRLLESARLARSPIYCLCNGQHAPLAMYVSRHGRSLVLKRSPGTGPHHHRLCPSHGAHTQPREQDRASNPAIETLPDAGIRVHLDVPLHKLRSPAVPAAPASPSVQPHANASPTKGRLSLLGFLEFLWERAALHRWHPENHPRRLSQVYRKIQEELFELHLGHVPASQAVFVPDTALDDLSMTRKASDMASRFADLSVLFGGDAPILLLVGEVRSLFDARYGSGMRIKGLPDTSTIWLSQDLAQQLAHSFRAPIQRFLSGRRDATKLFCIVGASLSSHGALNATSGAFLETSVDFLPVDSFHEARLANEMVAAKRRFTKPLRYNQQGKNSLHPDFLLHDAVGGDWAIEVWGLDSQEYYARKDEKILKYRENGTPVWQWNAISCSKIPPLPVASLRTGT